MNIITVDNHVELLNYVFDIFTGRQYGAEILTHPYNPDPAYHDNNITPDSKSETVTCMNGGTATFTPFFLSEYYDGGDRDGWNFNFDNCQYDANLYNGNIIRENIGSGAWLFMNSTGFTFNSQSEETSFIGGAKYLHGSVRGGTQSFSYELHNVDYVSTRIDQPVELVGATIGFSIYNFWSKTLVGKYSIRSAETQNRKLEVEVGV